MQNKEIVALTEDGLLEMLAACSLEKVVSVRVQDELLANPAWEGRADGQVVAAWGFIEDHLRNHHAWLMVRPGLPAGVLRQFVKTARQILKGTLGLPEVKRVQALIKIGHIGALRLALAIGFEIEGILRRHAEDGSDQYIVSMTEE